MLERLGLVDGCGIDEWEADRRSRLANHLLFWIWYLPLDLVGSKLGHTSSIHDQLRLAVRLGGHQALPLIDAAGGGGPAETAGLRNGTLQHVDAPSRRRLAHCSHRRHSPPVRGIATGQSPSMRRSRGQQRSGLVAGCVRLVRIGRGAS